MKIVKKMFIICIIIFMVMTIFLENRSRAEDGSDIYSSIKRLAGSDASSGTGAVDSTKRVAGAVVSIARVISAGVAIIMITILTMKYMYAAPSEKADVKKHAIPYIVGAVIMFSVTGILGILQNFAEVFD